MNEKTIAVGSGKGGVGKTTVSVNLALSYARKGLAVCLIDLDPLSDITTLLDIHEPEQRVLGAGQREQSSVGTAIPVFKRFDLLTPYHAGGEAGESDTIFSMMQETKDTLGNSYDILILDLPAGFDDDEHLRFLEFADHLVIVTQSEPTAHVSAGSYMKAVMENGYNCTLYIWHNRYSPKLDAVFNPEDVIGNYNRNVAAEERIDPNNSTGIRHIAHVPEDSSMDLLKANGSPMVSVLTAIEDTLRALYENRIADLVRDSTLPSRSLSVFTYYLKHNRDLSNLEQYMRDLERYFLNFLHERIGKEHVEKTVSLLDTSSGLSLSEEEREQCRVVVTAVKEDGIAASVRILLRLLEDAVEEASGTGDFQVVTKPSKRKDIDREFALLLTKLVATIDRKSVFERNFAGLLLFYFALFKLIHSPSVVTLIEEFIPRKKSRDSSGRVVRDRNTQIRYLIEAGTEYRKNYLGMVKTLFPLVMKQVGVIAKTFNVRSLVFQKDGSLHASVYAKLLSSFLHNSVNGGLGIIIGFPFRPASLAFKEASERLLQEIHS